MNQGDVDTVNNQRAKIAEAKGTSTTPAARAKKRGRNGMEKPAERVSW